MFQCPKCMIMEQCVIVTMWQSLNMRNHLHNLLLKVSYSGLSMEIQRLSYQYWMSTDLGGGQRRAKHCCLTKNRTPSMLNAGQSTQTINIKQRQRWLNANKSWWLITICLLFISHVHGTMTFTTNMLGAWGTAMCWGLYHSKRVFL